MKEAFWIIDQLVQQGVTRFCIAPGSRNTPLVIAAVQHPKATTLVHYDERGIGFYALGYGKGSKTPAAVITTSGTAVGNLLPSIMEASHSHTPLILLTTDRPPELRDCGANQTCHQAQIFSRFLRWEIDVPPQCTENYFRSLVAQGVFHAIKAHPGPIQINCQFREPLYVPTPPLDSTQAFHFPNSRLVAEPMKIKAKRGLILIGEIPSSSLPILQLASRLKWPVFADVLSNARLHLTQEQILNFDLILNTSSIPSPDFVLHFGARLTSKKLLETPVSLHVSPFPSLQDPTRSLGGRIQSDIASFCEQFDADTDPEWLSFWQQEDRRVQEVKETFYSEPHPTTEMRAMHQLNSLLPPDRAIFLANGMPIRDGDRFLFPKQCKGFFGNRGLSGIDGNIATVCGIADGLNAPILAIIGDQACLHDLNSLPLLHKTTHPVTLIASNNFGSGMFSHLPIVKWPQFETYMAATHSWRFVEAAKMFSIPYSTFPHICFDKSSLVELITSRDENYAIQQKLKENIQHPCPAPL